MVRIAIIGAGFSGMATAWHLLKLEKDLEVVVFDSVGIGAGASGIAAGLLHPYAGAHGKQNRYALEGMEATWQLIKHAEKALGKPVCQRSGLLRLALTDQQHQDFFLSSQKYQDVSWYTSEQCHILDPALPNKPGLFIHSAVSIDPLLYLQGLWLDCQQHSICFEQKKVTNLKELQGFDHIVLSVGSAWKLFPEMAHLPLTPIKGQILEFEWEHASPLPCPLNSQAYLIMHPSKNSCMAGATFERDFEHSEPCLEVAVKDIMPKAKELYPSLERRKILDCKAGIRVSTPDHLPRVDKVAENCWAITGMGSKGLLYHALFAKRLALSLLHQYM